MSNDWNPQGFRAAGYNGVIRNFDRHMEMGEEIDVFFRRVAKPRPLWEYLGRYRLSAENDLTTTEDPSKMKDKQFDTLLDQILPPACTSWNPRIHEWAAGKGKRWNGKGEEIAWLTARAHEMVRERDFWACNCVEFVGYDEKLYEFLVGQSQ